MQNMSVGMIIGQIFYGGLIVAILFLLFYKRKEKITVKQLLETALFVIISLALSVGLSYYISFAGAPVIKLGFAQPIMAIGGIILSTPLGFLAGIIIDLLGVIIHTEGMVYFGFTFNAGMCFLIASLIFKSTKNFSEKTMSYLTYGAYGTLLLGGTTLLLTIKNTIRLEKLKISLNETAFLIPNRYLLLVGLFVVVGAMIFLTKYSVHLLKNQNLKDVYRWILVMLFIEIIVNITLTSTHLVTMYSIPLQALLLPRIIKSIIMLPINIIFGYTILSVVRKIKK